LIVSDIHNIQGQSQGMTNDGLGSTSDVSITQRWNLLTQPLPTSARIPSRKRFSFSMHYYYWTSFSDGETVFFFSFVLVTLQTNTYRQSHDEQGWMISNHFSECTHNQCEENVLQANETEEVQI